MIFPFSGPKRLSDPVKFCNLSSRTCARIQDAGVRFTKGKRRYFVGTLSLQFLGKLQRRLHTCWTCCLWRCKLRARKGRRRSGATLFLGQKLVYWASSQHHLVAPYNMCFLDESHCGISSKGEEHPDRNIEKHLGARLPHPGDEAGSIVFHSSSNTSEIRNDNN